jgi:hypothetical protein
MRPRRMHARPRRVAGQTLVKYCSRILSTRKSPSKLSGGNCRRKFSGDNVCVIIDTQDFRETWSNIGQLPFHQPLLVYSPPHTGQMLVKCRSNDSSPRRCGVIARGLCFSTTRWANTGRILVVSESSSRDRESAAGGKRGHELCSRILKKPISFKIRRLHKQNSKTFKTLKP